MATVRGCGPDGQPTTVTVVARGDRVLLRVGAAAPVSLSPEQAIDLLSALRAEFHQAAAAMLDSRPRTGRAARPGSAGRSADGGGNEQSGSARCS